MPTSDAVNELLRRVVKIHSSPSVAMRLIHLTRDPDFDIDEIEACLECDPGLTASILRLTNSSFYGLRSEVDSIRRALVYLGRRSLRLAVLSFGIVKNLVNGAPSEIHQVYWRRSLTMAITARKLARHMQAMVIAANKQSPHSAKVVLDPDVAFTAGLLSDLGMLILMQLEPERYLPLALDSDHIYELCKRERKEFGFDHVVLAAGLLDSWQMPAHLVEAVALHHTAGADRTRPNPLLAANLLTEALWKPQTPHMPELRRHLQEAFGIGLDEMISLATESKDELHEAESLFGVHLKGSMVEVETLQEEASQAFASAAFETGADLDTLEAAALASGS